MYSYGFFCPLLVLFSYSPLRLTCCLLSLSYLSSTRSPVLSWLSHSDRTWVPAWRRRVYTKSHGRGCFSIFVPVVELVPHRIPRKSPVGPSSNLPHTSSSSWPCHQDSRSRTIHGAGPSVLGFVPSAVGLYEKKMSPVPTSPDLDKGPPKLVFCRDSPSTIRTRNSELGRHRMPSHPEAANRTWRPCDSGNVFKGPVPGYLGRGPLYSRTVIGCDIFLLLFYSFK